MPSTKIVVAYTTKLVDNYEALLPDFEGRSGTKDTAKIAQQIADKKQAFEAAALQTPYLCTFAEVHLFANNAPVRFAATKDRPISADVGAWLIKNYSSAWPLDIMEVPKKPVIFLGFAPRLFLKILGLECSMPPISAALPPSLWFGNSDHRDIETALIPTEHKKELNLLKVLRRRRPAGDDGLKWDAMLEGWQEPGHDPLADLRICTEVAAQLGFFERDAK